jgi:HlyD family secretion protein
MRSKIIFIMAGVGLILALVSAWVASQQPAAQKPVFNPAANPFANGIYAKGIIESAQPQGENINIYPEVTGPITEVLVAEGQKVRKGQEMLRIDDTVQRATTEQLLSQAQAAHALLLELKAEPRPENLDIATAQVDSACNAEKIAATNLEVVEKQYVLTKAGAWVFDVENQEKQYLALMKAHESAAALLGKYTLKAPADGVVRSVEATVGSYVSSQGAYDSYTQGLNPLIVMGAPDEQLHVRAYIDEILIDRLADPAKLRGEMFSRGTDKHVALAFVRIQPYVSPKIELSDQRQELVDVRVLPVIFSFANPKGLNVFPGELVDVYVSAK